MSDIHVEPAPEEDAKALWDSQVEAQDSALKATHNSREFTFTQNENRQLLKVATMGAMAREQVKIAQAFNDDYINNNVLPRIGIIPSENTRILFEPTLGRFIVWELKTSKPKKVLNPIPKTN